MVHAGHGSVAVRRVTTAEGQQQPRRRGRPPASAGPSTEQTILTAAREVFGELGYERTTVREVAERAGVTRPAINHYFKGKQGLYEAVFSSAQDAVVAAGLAGVGGESSTARRIGAFLQVATAVDARDPSYARFISSSLLDAYRHPELGDRPEAQLGEVRSFVRATLTEGVEAGEVRADLDVSATTEMLVAVMWGMGLYAGFVGSHEQLEGLVEQFTRLLEGELL